jgi:hypothetical protein
MINWQEIAQQNDLSIDEFEKEIYSVAACIAAMQLDKKPNVDSMRFTCSDEVGRL